MALTLNGSTQWPNAKELQRLSETRAGCTPSRARQILEQIGEAISAASAEVRTYIKEHPAFAEIGERMLDEWEKGTALSLKGS
jgi:serine/threonine-protein kinase HipA